jgi:succinoglycan biosynthesis protein ExoA
MSSRSVSIDLPKISVLIPVYNEEEHIENCISSLLASGYPQDLMEILVCDGRSTDATRDRVRKMALTIPRLRLLDNPGKIQSVGTNVGAAESDPDSEFLIRVDAHADYPEGFLGLAVETALKTGADLVVYVNHPVGRTPFQQAVAMAFSHPLGVGDSTYRLGKFSGWVDHGQQGCFRRETFQKLGGYDETLRANEDSELSHRLLKSGGRIYLNADLRMYYYPRRTPAALARQYYFYGYGRAMNSLKHGAVKWRQMAPPALLFFEILCLVLLAAKGIPPGFRALAWCWLVYPAIVLGVTGWECVRRRSWSLLWLPPVFSLMHHFWAWGFVYGLLTIRRKRSVQA